MAQYTDFKKVYYQDSSKPVGILQTSTGTWKAPLKIRFMDYNKTEELCDPIDCVWGDTVTLPIPPKPSYVDDAHEFDRWQYNDSHGHGISFNGGFLVAEQIIYYTCPSCGDEASPLGEIILGALWKYKTFTVRFLNWDGSVLSTQSVQYGQDATPPSNPTRPADSNYTYTFSGWNKAYTNITADTDITAQYTATAKATWHTLLSGSGVTIRRNQTASISGVKAGVPTRASFAGRIYTNYSNISAAVNQRTEAESDNGVYTGSGSGTISGGGGGTWSYGFTLTMQDGSVHFTTRASGSVYDDCGNFESSVSPSSNGYVTITFIEQYY